jgi:hypothetical protein
MKLNPKRTYIRSPKLLSNCQYLSCQLCGAEDDTVVAAHSNSSAHGKGRSIKADDNMIAALCYLCHAEIDQGTTFTKDEKESLWNMAHLKTVYRLIEADLWPDRVPIPQSYLDYKNRLN